MHDTDLIRINLYVDIYLRSTEFIIELYIDISMIIKSIKISPLIFKITAIIKKSHRKNTKNKN